MGEEGTIIGPYGYTAIVVVVVVVTSITAAADAAAVADRLGIVNLRSKDIFYKSTYSIVESYDFTFFHLNRHCQFK
jgi:hypothetical protein